MYETKIVLHRSNVLPTKPQSYLYDEGYDGQKIRTFAHNWGARLFIKHRECLYFDPSHSQSPSTNSPIGCLCPQ